MRLSNNSLRPLIRSLQKKRNKGRQPTSVLTINGRVTRERRWWHGDSTGSEAPLEAILESHLIPTVELRADDFQAFYEARKQSLLKLIESVMGKPILVGGDAAADDDLDEEDDSA